MNIIFIASLKSYTTAISLIKAFQNQKHDIHVLSDIKSDYVQIDEIVHQNFDIYKYIKKKEIKPDIIFFCEGGSMKLFPQGLEIVECKTAWYGIDTHMDLIKHIEISKFFDITFLAQKEFVNIFTKTGLLNTFWLPLAFDFSMLPITKLQKVYDISYVGSNNNDLHPIRFDLIAKLKKEFPNSYFGQATGQDMYKIYSQSKIVFNKSINNDINMRYFEALGNGAMLLTDKINENGVEEIFEKQKHFLEYDNSNIVTVAKAYLESNINESDYLQDFIFKKHTYEMRVSKIIDHVNLCHKEKKNIKIIDYSKIYLLLENFTAFLTSLRLVFINDLIKSNLKRKIIFMPLLIILKITNIILGQLRKLAHV
jgi:hypothetical protein